MFHTQPTKRSRFLFFSSQEEEAAAARFRRETDFVTKSNKEVKTDPTKNRSSPLTLVKKCAHTINCFVKNRSALCLSLNSVKKRRERAIERTNIGSAVPALVRVARAVACFHQELLPLLKKIHSFWCRL